MTPFFVLGGIICAVALLVRWLSRASSRPTRPSDSSDALGGYLLTAAAIGGSDEPSRLDPPPASDGPSHSDPTPTRTTRVGSRSAVLWIAEQSSVAADSMLAAVAPIVAVAARMLGALGVILNTRAAAGGAAWPRRPTAGAGVPRHVQPFMSEPAAVQLI